MPDLQWLANNLSVFETLCPYWHPLGFVTCLLRDYDGYAMRLHYWPQNDRRPKTPNWPIHNHRYDLRSKILSGSLQDIRYNIVEFQTGEPYVIYAVKYKGIHSEIVPTSQKVGVTVRSSEIWKAKSAYSIPVGDFHETIVDIGSEAVTLVECTNFQPADPAVVGREGDVSLAYERTGFDRVRFWQVIRSTFESAV